MGNLIAVDLFAGAGGLSLGLVRAGFRVAAAVELDPHAAASFQLNHKSARVVVDDVRNITARSLCANAGLGGRRLDLLTGCPPCQGFSTLRTRRQRASVADPRNGLILEFLRLIRGMKPRAVVLENVPGLADDPGYRVFCRALSRLGYNYTAGVVDAAEFGVPQRRRRLVLAALHGTDLPDGLLRPGNHKPTTVRDGIGDLPKAGRSGDPLHDLPERRSAAVLARIRATPKDGGSRTDLALEDQCLCHQKSSGFFDVYGRMAWSGPAPTITSGCSNPSKGRFVHPTEHRAITLREAALLQSFPHDYQFDMSRGKEHVAAQIGNAFPPDLITPIARRIAKVLRA